MLVARVPCGRFSLHRAVFGEIGTGATVIFRVVGGLEVTLSNEVLRLTAEKPRRMLALLLLRANQWVPDSELVDTIWPAGAPASAAGNLKTYATQLRQMVGPRVDRQPGAYRLEVARDELDAAIFENLVEQGVAARDPEAALTCLTEALALWRGTPYESLDVEAAVSERARLTELRWSARTAHADALVAVGRHDEAIASLRAMTTEDPLRERAWLRLMETLHERGRRAEALSTFHTARRAIVDELGIEPGAELQDLHLRMLRADDTPPAPALPEPTPVVRRRSRKPAVLTAAALVATAALVVSLVLVWQPQQTDLSATTAAARWGWGLPRHSSEFTDGLDGWGARGPVAGRDGKGQQLPSQVTVRDVATITGLPNGHTGFIERRPGFLHGRLEARIRVPKGCTCYRAVVTLYPEDDDPTRGGEVVYLETLDGDRQKASFYLSVPGESQRLEAHRSVDLTQWNHFAVEWTDEHITAYVNGEAWYTTNSRTAVPPGPMFPTIKLDFLPGKGVAPVESKVEIDWVREYGT